MANLIFLSCCSNFQRKRLNVKYSFQPFACDGLQPTDGPLLILGPQTENHSV